MCIPARGHAGLLARTECMYSKDYNNSSYDKITKRIWLACGGIVEAPFALRVKTKNLKFTAIILSDSTVTNLQAKIYKIINVPTFYKHGRYHTHRKMDFKR